MLRDNQGESRIASPELLPKARSLPHLICSRRSNLGGGDEEGEHGDAHRVGGCDQRAKNSWPARN